MKKTRRTEKTVEIHEFYAIRTASGSSPKLCADCTTDDAIMLAPEHTAVLAHISTRTIYRLVEAGEIHYRESSDGSLMVCVGSLVAALGTHLESSPTNGEDKHPTNQFRQSDQDQSWSSVKPTTRK